MRIGGRRDYSNLSVVIQKGTPIAKKAPSQQAHSRNRRHTNLPAVVNQSSAANGSSSSSHHHHHRKMKATKTTTATPANARIRATAERGRKPRAAPLPAWTGVMRLFILELPLGLLFATLLTVYAVRNIYQDLYVPLMDRATRTDADLDREFTYYHRYCTEADLTTRNINDLVADSKAPVSVAVEQMMQHGALVIRDLFKQDTVRKLRDYIVYKNTHIPEEEVYPVSQGRNRMSFGFDATEHPIVVQALQELANNKFLKTLLSELLGDPDPASSEITSITAYYDAPPQAWHSDTKEDGNALKFGRTYSQSYSLFLPLQNTVGC